MRFGVNSLLFTDTFTERDLPLIKHVNDLGFEVFEITPVDPDAFPATEVRRQADELGMTININFALPEAANPISPNPENRELAFQRSCQIIDICADVQAEIYCGANYAAWRYMTGKKRTQDEWRWGVETMQRIADYASTRTDTIIAVEVLNRFESFFLNTAADANRFVQDVDRPNVMVHLDTFHMIREENSMSGAIAATGDRLGYFHACGSHRGITGQDLVPWEETLTALRDSGYTGPITIESFHPDLSVAPLVAVWRDFAESPEQLATESLAFLRRMTAGIYGNS